MPEWMELVAAANRRRRIAWIAAVCIMVFSVLFGSYRHFNNMRGDALGLLENEVLPGVSRQLEFAHQMVVLARRNGIGGERTEDFYGLIRLTENADDADAILRWQRLLPREAARVYAGIHGGMGEQDVNFIRNAYLNFNEQQTMIRQSGYDALAAEFNDALGRGTGPIARIFIRTLPLTEPAVDFEVYFNLR